jgi:predicted ribosomally synthesized peptide with nif11-like leader
MSVEKAKEFLIKASTEQETSLKADQAYRESLLSVAKEMGYEFDADELRAAMEDLSSFGELSEGELEQVAGGIYRDSLFWFKSPGGIRGIGGEGIKKL